ncbi:rhodanese-related sulfurtransferase [Synechococcus moorigangaii CMS01]|nr:rhodanese-related sulfurtransferase [Synechococcus moorigangaii CMS01]
MKDFVVITFYKFFDFPDYQERQQAIFNCAAAQNIIGTILLAPEGINATIAGTQSALDALVTFLRNDPRLADLTYKVSTAPKQPFKRLKVKLKKEIVTLGQPNVDPNNTVGTYIDPQDWNDLIQNPDVTLVDTRNDYEVGIGTFKGAINPNTKSFREFPEYVAQNLDPKKHPKVAMFCTGGIRCEKATSYLLNQGFQEVYHLKGGILKYLEEIPTTESLWEGECFVFDERVTVKHGLETGQYELCYACGHPIDATDKASAAFEMGVSCPYCIEALTPERRSRFEARWQQRQQMKGCQAS